MSESRRYFLPGLVWLLSSVTACHLPGQFISSLGPGQELANFRAPTTGKQGVPIPVTIYLVALGGCDVADWAKADVDQGRRLVTLRGATRNEEYLFMLCTNAIHYPSIVTHFTPQATGTYTLKARFRPNAGSNTGGYDHLQPRIDDSLDEESRPIEFSQTITVTE